MADRAPAQREEARSTAAPASDTAPHPDAEIVALAEKCPTANQRYEAAGAAFDESEQRRVDIKPPQALIKTEEDAKMRLFVCVAAGSSYNRAEIAALSAIRRSLDLPSSETLPVYRRCRAIIEAWREWTAREEAESTRSGYMAADRVQRNATSALTCAAEELVMTPALTVDGVLAKARAFRTFSLIDTVAEQIVQDGVFELEVLALSLASDLFSLAKPEARS
jgi:hypothetical protein